MDENGYPNTKAMLPPRRREGIKVFYFTTNTSSMRVSQYKYSPKACIYFCDRRFFWGGYADRYYGGTGRQLYKEMIWQEGDTDVLSRRSDGPRLLCFKIYKRFPEGFTSNFKFGKFRC